MSGSGILSAPMPKSTSSSLTGLTMRGARRSRSLTTMRGYCFWNSAIVVGSSFYEMEGSAPMVTVPPV